MRFEITGIVLRIAGLEELTAVNADRFRKGIHAAVEGHSIVEVDLSETATMDCSGLGALIALGNVAQRRNTRVRLVNPNRVVQQLLKVMQTGVLFEIVEVNDESSPDLPGVPGHVLEFQACLEVHP